MTDLNDSPRAKLLAEASRLITGDRNNQYGPPTQDFRRTAELLQALGYRGPSGRDLVSHDIAVIMIQLKMSRIVWTPGKEDSWTDMAGYTGCGWECVTEEQKPETEVRSGIWVRHGGDFDPDVQNTEAVAGTWSPSVPPVCRKDPDATIMALKDRYEDYWQPQADGTWTCWHKGNPPSPDDDSLSGWSRERVEQDWGPLTVIRFPWA